MDNKVKILVEQAMTKEKNRSIMEYLALIIATRGYYTNRVANQNLSQYFQIKVGSELDLELFSGYSEPFISGKLIKAGNKLVLTEIDGIYQPTFSETIPRKLEDIIEWENELIWETIDNTFKRSVQIDEISSIEDIQDNEVIIRIAKNEYIMITKHIKTPLLRFFKSTKNVLRKEMEVDKLIEKLGGL